MENWTSVSSGPDLKVVQSAMHGTACQLVKNLALQSKDNVFLSPFSISLAMAMVYGGAVGETGQELSQAFSFPEVSLLNAQFRQLINSLHQGTSENVLKVASSLWIDNSLVPGVNQNFINQASESYSASIYPVDFASPNTIAQLNAWVSHATEGKIASMVDDVSGSVSLIASAIYFAGMWGEPFEKNSSLPGKFYTMDGGELDCVMMNNTKHYRYFESQSAQTVFLPYIGASQTQELVMAVVLPKAGVSLFDVLDTDMVRIFDTAGQAVSQKVELTLPAFKIDYSCSLVEVLKTLGVIRAFDPQGAQFDNLCSGLYISQAIHKSILEVTEEGTVAAAVTVTAVATGLGKAPSAMPVRFNVDRPFLLSILDLATATTLFVGGITRPEQLS